jgi:hypothetical protein
MLVNLIAGAHQGAGQHECTQRARETVRAEHYRTAERIFEIFCHCAIISQISEECPRLLQNFWRRLHEQRISLLLDQKAQFSCTFSLLASLDHLLRCRRGVHGG